jgi:hypothetical protein
MTLLRVCGYKEPPRDDRGQEISLAKRNAMLHSLEPRSRKRFVLTDAFAFAGRTWRPEPMLGPLRWGNAIMQGTLALVGLVALIAVFTAVPSDDLVLVMIISILSMLVFVTHHHRLGSNHLMAMTALGDGLCAACAFSLEGLAPEDDGCVICPECGHAWNHLRIVRPHWAPGDDTTARSRDPRLDWRKSFKIMMTTGYTPDDCGRLVRLHSTHLWGIAAETRAQHDPEELRSLRTDLRALGRLKRLLAFAIGMMLSVLASVYWVIPAYGSSIAAGITLGGMVLMVLIASVTMLMSSNWSGAQRIVGRVCARGWCGSCLNDLSQTVPNANAMRVCDLCKASWLDDRFVACTKGAAADATIDDHVPKPTDPV